MRGKKDTRCRFQTTVVASKCIVLKLRSWLARDRKCSLSVRKIPFLEVTLQMPFDIHALVQDAHNPNALLLGPINYNVRLILKPPQVWREFLRAASLHRMFGKRGEALV